MKRQFALARHKYAFYDPVSGVHLTLERPVSPVLNDQVVDVSRLERAVRLGSLIELTQPPVPKPAPEPPPIRREPENPKNVDDVSKGEKPEATKAEEAAAGEVEKPEPKRGKKSDK